MKTYRLAGPLIAVLALVIAACGTSGAPSPAADPGTGLAIGAEAGPTCPVEQPGDPACKARPVAGATVIVVDRQGTTVATAVTDPEGLATVALPAGEYVVQPQPVQGMMGTAEQQTVTVVDGTMTPVTLAYDTGIR